MMLKFLINSVLAAGLIVGLSGCTNVMDKIHSSADDPQIDVVEEEAPQLPSLFMSWPLSDHTLISAPVDIQNKALAACQARGYDSSYMVHIAIEGDTAKAEFGCRGFD